MNSGILEKITKHFDNVNYDIKKTGNARFFDQKCTPDILCAVSECITVFSEENNSKKFSVKDIWSSSLANEIMTKQFQKPDVKNTKAQNEYDKIFSQPIKLLEYANVISASGKRGNTNIYEIKNNEILEYVGQGDQKALKFLLQYIKKVLKDSEIYYLYENFLEKQNKDSFNYLKDTYLKFIIDNTPINTDIEVRRIFPKILNPLAYAENKIGSKDGRLSKTPISYTEIMYNRPNFRDELKPKNQPRREYVGSASEEVVKNYLVAKAKRKIKLHHKESEVHRYEYGDATQVHHIFPINEFPEFSDTYENLILLTPQQHYEFAHPKNDTHKISKSYQLVCLLSKLDSIEMSKFWADDFYDIHTFINMINKCLNHNLLMPNMTIPHVKNAIAKYYLDSSVSPD